MSEKTLQNQHDSDASEENRHEPERRSVVDRRGGLSRRRKQIPVEVERRGGKDRRSRLDRRRGPGRRRSDTRRAAEEGEMTDEQWEFLEAINEYKKVNSRPFPTWTEVLDILHALGYQKVAERKKIE